MAQIRLQGPAADLESPTLVEGFPGIGLVGKIATDHLITQFEMRHYASVHCDGLPRIGVYRAGSRTVQPPVRIYVSEAENLLALQSDAPIAAKAAGTVATCVTGWLIEHDVTPLFLSGFPAEREEGKPGLFGVATGDGADRLEAAGINAPPGDGVISGPTGALINHATHVDLESIALVVESNPQFPDPEAAKAILESGFEPITGLAVDTSHLLEQAEEIREQREQFAKRMQAMAADESSQAQPLRMYQ